MEIRVEGGERVRKQLTRIPGFANEAAKSIAYELAETTHGNIVSRLQSGIKHNDGGLAESFKVSDPEGEGNVTASVFSDNPASWYREFGTGPNGEKSVKDLPENVNPVYKQEPWFFPVSSVNKDLNTRYGIPIVNIKGTLFYYSHGQPARPYMYPAYKDAVENLDDIVTRNVNNILKRGLNDGI